MSRRDGNQAMKFAQLIEYNKRIVFFKASTWRTTKNKLYETFDYQSRDMLNLDFLEKDLGIVSPPHYVYDFSRQICFRLYSIN